MTYVLEAKGLVKRFGAIAVTNGVDLHVPVGARMALIGPNGAGKSTLVGLLTGQLKPSGGCVMLEGRDVTRVAPEKRVRHGLVRTFQINNLFRGLTVLENVYLAVSERTGVSRSFFRPASGHTQVIERARVILSDLGLDGVRDEQVSQLAYGQQRLVEIAIALSLEPKVLLLDEPAAGIPSLEAGRLMDVIEALPAELAIVMIEHDMHLVRRFAREVTVLVQGTVLARGTPADVMARQDVLQVYLGGPRECGRRL